MAVREERYNSRDLCFSNWHRYQLNEFLKATDLDFMEWCHRCYSPLALIEIARDVGQESKFTAALRRLAAMSGLPLYLVFYVSNGKKMRKARVLSLRVSRIFPVKSGEIKLTPNQYELFLVLLRDRHKCFDSVPLSWWKLNYTLHDLELVEKLLLPKKI